MPQPKVQVTPDRWAEGHQLAGAGRIGDHSVEASRQGGPLVAVFLPIRHCGRPKRASMVEMWRRVAHDQMEVSLPGPFHAARAVQCMEET